MTKQNKIQAPSPFYVLRLAENDRQQIKTDPHKRNVSSTLLDRPQNKFLDTELDHQSTEADEENRKKNHYNPVSPMTSL